MPQDISPDVLRQLLRYEPETGKLFWLNRAVDWFTDGAYPAARECKRWNARYAGKEAFTASNGDGYFHGKVQGVVIKAHRVIWAMQEGVWPDNQVDHLNGIRSDNRWGNLRAATHAENMKNQKKRKNTSSQYRGVYWRKDIKRWISAGGSGIRGNHVYLGCYVDETDAARAYDAFAKSQYGAFANLNFP